MAITAKWRTDSRTWRRLLQGFKRLRVRAFSAAWGANAKRQVLLRQLVDLLTCHGGFAWGDRVAFSLSSLVRELECSARTVSRLLGRLRELRRLVQVHWIPEGAIAWDGLPARTPHYEFAMGPDLHACSLEILGGVGPATRDLIAQTGTNPIRNKRRQGPTSPAATPSRTAPVSPSPASSGSAGPRVSLEESSGIYRASSRGGVDTVSLDLTKRSTTETNTKFSSSSEGVIRRGSRARLEPTAATPPPLPTRQSPRPPAPARPPQPQPELPAWIVRTVRQHRRIAEVGKGPAVPISASEAQLIEDARAQYGSVSDAQWLQAAERASRQALNDSKRGTATLTFAFGGRANAKAHYFADRMARVRESMHSKNKERWAKESRAAQRTSAGGALLAKALGRVRDDSSALDAQRQRQRALAEKLAQLERLRIPSAVANEVRAQLISKFQSECKA